MEKTAYSSNNLDMGEELHIATSNASGKCTVNSRTLRSIDVQRNFGAQVRCSPKAVTQADKVVKEAYDMVSFIFQGVKLASHVAVI